MSHFVVVGAGLGGLASALRLAHLGHRVTILEKTDQIGGRNREICVNDCSFDAGPTLLMMLAPLRRLFADIGEQLEDHLSLSLCDPSYRVFYADGARIEATTNVERMTAQIEEMSGKDDAAAYPRMLKDLADLYKAAIPNFVERNFYGPGDFFGARSLTLVARHGMLQNYARRVGRYYRDPRLHMLFSFQAMYLGLSPYRAPWVYATLTHMEYGEGIWYVQGGLVEMCRRIARLAEDRGANIRRGSAVRRIEDRHVELESGERIEADTIICNADLPYAARELLHAPTSRRLRYSCSSFMMYLDYGGSLPELRHHNVFFGNDFKGNLDDIFARNHLPEDPAFYACVSAKTDPAKAPAGHENLMVLIPCPNLERPWDDSDADKLRRVVFERLGRECGFNPTRLLGMSTRSPKDWATELNLDQGAAFGLSHDFWQSAYFRPANRSQSNPDVYYVGASTVPGNGLPMVLISAELLEARLKREARL